MPLLHPVSIAVVGASPRGNRGLMVLENLRRFQFPGRVQAVNPNYDKILGVPCVGKVSDLSDDVVKGASCGLAC